MYYAIQNQHWSIVKSLIQAVSFNQFSAEDKRLIQTFQKEIVWAFYKKSAYSTKNTGKSSIVSMIMQSSSLFKSLAKDFLTDNRHGSPKLQKTYDKNYGLQLYRPK